jgi:hypothetical protein
MISPRASRWPSFYPVWIGPTKSGRHDQREAQIVLATKFGTQLRWGRPPSAKDAFVEVSATQKLAAIENLYEHAQRVDDNQPWLDLRFDRVTCPVPADSPTAEPDSPLAAR